MLLRLILLFAALIGAYFLFRRLRRLGWSQQIRRIAAVAGISAALLLLAVRGGAEVALPLLTVLAPFLWRWLSASLPSLHRYRRRALVAPRRVTTCFCG